MGKEQSPAKEYELNPSARVWVGMEQIDPEKRCNRARIISGEDGKVTITFCGLGLEVITFEDRDAKIPIMAEHLIPLSAPIGLDTKVQRDDPVLWVDSKWLTSKVGKDKTADPVQLEDTLYRPFYPKLNSPDDE